MKKSPQDRTTLLLFVILLTVFVRPSLTSNQNLLSRMTIVGGWDKIFYSDLKPRTSKVQLCPIRQSFCNMEIPRSKMASTYKTLKDNF